MPKAAEKKPRTRRKTESVKPISFEDMRQWIYVFNELLTTEIIDEEKSLPGSEAKYKPLYNEDEQLVIKGRLFYMIKLMPSL